MSKEQKAQAPKEQVVHLYEGGKRIHPKLAKGRVFLPLWPRNLCFMCCRGLTRAAARRCFLIFRSGIFIFSASLWAWAI
mgnify:CR=1 FL=1